MPAGRQGRGPLATMQWGHCTYPGPPRPKASQKGERKRATRERPQERPACNMLIMGESKESHG